MNKYAFDPKPYRDDILAIVNEVAAVKRWTPKSLQKILPRHPRDGNAIFSRDQLVMGYRLLVSEKLADENPLVLERIRMKPTRTVSGVAPVTVLTKPFPCPGKCIFCPNDVRMPKSYLADEPGAQRAERNMFDPYLQVFNRLRAFMNTGHSTDKVELIVLGGTWSFYPEEYQIWFIKRCFDALNDFGVRDRRDEVKSVNMFEEANRIPRKTADGRTRSYNEIVHAVSRGATRDLLTASELSSWSELEEAQVANESASSRCVGLVIETRPDYIDEHEVIKIRRLGATKVQIGIQSLNDRVMELNRRGHGAKETAAAIHLLRRAGFKIHAHWMPNLYGSTPDSDIDDYKKLWQPEFSPDELKIYPTSVIANTVLHEKYKQGEYSPYTYEELLQVLTGTMPLTPRYCRLTRVVRDIPSTDIVAGNKRTNFRQIAEEELNKMGSPCQCIRCREIRGRKISPEDLQEERIEYKTSAGTEHFLSWKTRSDDRIVGFLRLLLPDDGDHFIPELAGNAVIREVHVYGQVVALGERQEGRTQHLGIGSRLIRTAEDIARSGGFSAISVISAIGTRKYYYRLGFRLHSLYMHKPL
ncbi:MAG: coproporphyrinogen III oxidase [candidate division WS6 bacterium OLB20]|uniref:Elongator complex protein 3 n=1 Tax=candidate division WS6 bacterium OLB20 TaxID=1617426 RepID=A0A136LW63_9BACT|nr:MAG: coproporphyrinogen III oxidase [candidate division WS6 bacterium OLB20]